MNCDLWAKIYGNYSCYGTNLKHAIPGQIHDNIKNLPEPEKNSLGAGIPRRLLNQIVPKDPILERNFIEF